MDRDSTTLILLALMVLGGTFGMRRSSEGAGEKSAERAAERDQAESTYGSPSTAAVDLIGRFFESRYPTDQDAGVNAGAKYSWSFGGSSVNRSLEVSSVSDQDDLARSLPKLRDLRDLSKRKKFDVEFMIATVPDPVDSHVGWEMDPIMDAIQRGFEANGFVLDRFYFPWQGYTPKPADPNKLVFPIHWRYPGVILFRSATLVPAPDELDATKFHNPKLHVVLLVGETPTRGMHKTALARALDVIAAWKAAEPLHVRMFKIAQRQARSQALARVRALASAVDVAVASKAPDWATEPRRLCIGVLQTALARALDMVAAWKAPSLHFRILGPNFSGSSMSLRYALEEWVSGASGIEAIKAYKWSSIEFQMVTGSAQDVRNKPTLQFKLPKQDEEPDGRWRTHKVGSTFHSTMVPSMAFNKCVFTNYLDQRNDVDRRQIALLVETDTAFGEQVTKGASDKPTDLGPREGSAEQQPIILQYPMQIGRVRAAYERDRALVPEENRAEQGPPRSHLQLRLKENPTANDLLPTFSPLTETSAATVLEDMLAALGRSGIRYLGIIGTDPMDILFLARLAHRSCPDTQLFATQADLLFTHAAYRVYTDGMLIFSPYPLFIKSQAWMPHAPHQRMRRQFSDSWAAAGTFNASCSLLASHGRSQSVDYAFPFDFHSQVTKPPVWCLVVANGAFWPVECYPWVEGDSDQSPDSYNDAVDRLIRSDYVSQLRTQKPHLTESDWRTSAKKLWDKESKRYGFNDTDTEYMLRGPPPSAKQEPLRAHLAELALGLDGFLGFVSLILSAFSLLNCAQYVASGCTSCCDRAFGWRSCCDGAFVRWSLFYIPSSIEDRPVLAEASRYRFYFFVVLWLAEVAVLSPLLAGTCFPIDWQNGLHPRQWWVLAMGLLALLLLTIVVFVALVTMIAATRGHTFFPWGRGWVRRLLRSARKLRWQVFLRLWVRYLPRAPGLPWGASLAISLAAPAAFLLAWLAGICFPWDDSWRGVGVISATLLAVLLVAWPLSLLLGWKQFPPQDAAAAGQDAEGGAGGEPAAAGDNRAEAEGEPADVGGNQDDAAGDLAGAAPDPANAPANPADAGRKPPNAGQMLADAAYEWVASVGNEVWLKVAVIAIAAVLAFWAWQAASDYWIAISHLLRFHGPFSADLTRVAMFTERAGNLASGVSPILPALCVFGGIALVVVCHLRRIRWLCWRPIESPIPASTSLELAAIHKQIEELAKTLHRPPVAWFGWLPLLLVASVGSLVVFAWPRETFETQLFKWFVRVGLLTLLGVITVTWFQTLAVFDCLRQLLYRLAWHPMSTAYVRMPGALKRKFRAQLFATVPTNIESELPLQQWQYLRHEARKVHKETHNEWVGWLVEKTEQLDFCTDSDRQAHKALARLLINDATLAAQGCDGRLSKYNELKRRRVIATWSCTRSELLADWLDDWWEARRERNPEPREKKRSRPPKDPADRVDRLCEKAEEFVAIQLALVVRSVLAHLKNYLATSMAVVMLLLGMLNSYPFQPHRMLLIVGWAIGLFIIGTALWIFVVCNRDEALSRLSGLHPNKIDWDQQFILSVFSYGVVPVLVLLSIQFPEYGSYVYSPLEFVSKVLK